MARKLTDTWVRKQPPGDPQTQISDSAVAGLYILIGRKSRTWFVKQRGVKIRLGTFPNLGTQAARRLAITARAPVKLTLEAARALVDDIASKTAETYDHVLNGHLKDWRTRPLGSITRAMVKDRHRAIAGRSMANLVFRIFRSWWNRARKVEEDLPECPTIAITWHKERPRVSEMGDLADWQRGLHPDRRAWYLMCLLTGSRAGALCAMDPAIDVVGDVLTFRKAKGRPYSIPITAAHHALLVGWKQFDRMRRHRGDAFTPHDLRHRFAAGCVEAGLDVYTIKLLLGHSAGSDITMRYIRAADVGPAMEKVTAHLMKRLQITIVGL